jgi:hypothetical protein
MEHKLFLQECEFISAVQLLNISLSAIQVNLNMKEVKLFASTRYVYMFSIIFNHLVVQIEIGKISTYNLLSNNRHLDARNADYTDKHSQYWQRDYDKTQTAKARRISLEKVRKISLWKISWIFYLCCKLIYRVGQRKVQTFVWTATV